MSGTSALIVCLVFVAFISFLIGMVLGAVMEHLSEKPEADKKRDEKAEKILAVTEETKQNIDRVVEYYVGLQAYIDKRIGELRR